MRRFRFLLSLLLCLTVPVAGWASLRLDPACFEHGQGGLAATSPVPAHAPAHHEHENCADERGSGAPCKGDACGCGCGFGACTSSACLEVSAALQLPVLRQPLPLLPVADVAHADAGISTLLRPPIA